MTKKFVALVLAAVVAVNVNVFANTTDTHIDLAQVAAEINNLVAEAEKTGLTQAQAVECVAQEIAASQASTWELTPEQKRATVIILSVIAVSGIASLIYWKQDDLAKWWNAVEAKQPVVNPAPEVPGVPAPRAARKAQQFERDPKVPGIIGAKHARPGKFSKKYPK